MKVALGYRNETATRLFQIVKRLLVGPRVIEADCRRSSWRPWPMLQAAGAYRTRGDDLRLPQLFVEPVFDHLSLEQRQRVQCHRLDDPNPFTN